MRNIIGHETAQQQFWDSCKSGKMAQSWIFLGPKGIGKSTFAKHAVRELLAGTISAKAVEIAASKPTMLFAEEAAPAPITPDSIHHPDHPIYRKVELGTHPDLLIIDTKVKEGEKKKNELGVDAIREVPNFLRLAAAEGSWRIVVIDDAEMMNKNAANALLKILEEPPPKSLIILIASTLGYFPPTIRSRCRVLKFTALPDDALRGYMRENFPAVHRPEDQSFYIQFAAGSLGNLKLLIEAEALSLYAEIKRMLEYMQARKTEWPRVHMLAEKCEVNPEVAQMIFNRLCETAIRPVSMTQPDSAREIMLRLKTPSGWLDYYDQMQDLVGKQQFLYLDGKQTWLNVMAKMAA